jgi:hypothetical protein
MGHRTRAYVGLVAGAAVVGLAAVWAFSHQGPAATTETTPGQEGLARSATEAETARTLPGSTCRSEGPRAGRAPGGPPALLRDLARPLPWPDKPAAR